MILNYILINDDAEKFTSEMHDPCTRQPLPARENNTETPLRGTGVESAKHPPKVKSGNAFTTLECQRGVNYAYLFVRILGPFYSSEVLSPFLGEQASSLQSQLHPCRASFILVDQVSFLQTKFHSCRPSFLKRGGQAWAFVLSGAHIKDGLYPPWAYGHGPIGLAKPYLIFYPLQLPPSPHLVRRCCANGQLG